MENLFRFILIRNPNTIEESKGHTISHRDESEIANELAEIATSEKKGDEIREEVIEKAKEFQESDQFITVIDSKYSLVDVEKSLSQNGELIDKEKIVSAIGNYGKEFENNLDTVDQYLDRVLDTVVSLLFAPSEDLMLAQKLVRYLKFSTIVLSALREEKWNFGEGKLNELLQNVVIVLPRQLHTIKKAYTITEIQNNNGDEEVNLERYTRALKQLEQALSSGLVFESAVELNSDEEMDSIKVPGIFHRIWIFFFGRTLTTRNELDVNSSRKITNNTQVQNKFGWPNEVADKFDKESLEVYEEVRGSFTEVNPIVIKEAIESQMAEIISANEIPTSEVLFNGSPISNITSPHDQTVFNEAHIPGVGFEVGGLILRYGAAAYYQGVGDLMLTAQKLKNYELGDFAHIENILASESKKRIHKSVDERLTEDITIEEITEESEKDLQSTERHEMQEETQKAMQLKLEAGANVSASYFGPGYSIAADVGAQVSYQISTSSRRASEFAKEITSRAIERIKTRRLTERRVKVINRIEQTSEHGFDNSVPPFKNIRGVYRWLNKIYDVQLLNYGRRHMFKFVLPEPALVFISEKLRASEINLQIPPELDISPGDIDRTNWKTYIKKFNARGVKAPPASIRHYTWTTSHKTPSGDDFFAKDHTIEIDPGYRAEICRVASAKSSRINDNVPGQGRIRIIVGSRIYITTTSNGRTNWFNLQDGLGTARQRQVSVGVVGLNSSAYAVTVDLYCYPTEEGMEEWRMHVWDAIVEGHALQQARYEEKLDELKANQNVKIEGNNPLENTRIISHELQRQCVSLLVENNTFPISGMMANDSGIDFNSLADFQESVKFFENAFEWEHMTYTTHPYFWGRRKTWGSKMQITNGADPVMADFLRAGAATVQVPLREEYIATVLQFLQLSHFNPGLGDTIIDDEYIADAIADVANAPTDDTPEVVDEWNETVPTSLVLLQDADNITFSDSISGEEVALSFGSGNSQEET